MEFWITLLGIVAFIFLFPYARCFFKRIACAVKIKRLCKRKGYKLYPTHAMWFFGGKRGQKCDCHIEAPSEVYSITLFGVKNRSNMLIFQGENKYFIRSFIVLIHYAHVMFGPIESKLKSLPTYDFDHKFSDEWKGKRQRYILLLNPVPISIRQRSDLGNECNVNDGDIVNGMELHSLPNLLKNLNNEI